MATFLEGHPGWSAFWDKRDGVWRAAEDDPSSELYVEDADADRVIDYIVTQTRRDGHDHGELELARIGVICEASACPETGQAQVP
jgi:hypothetical protein